MMLRIKIFFSLFCGFLLTCYAGSTYCQEKSGLAARNEILFEQIKAVHNPTDQQMEAVRAIFAKSGYLGQGNPSISEHPVTPEECEENLARKGVNYDNPSFTEICGAKFMAPLYSPSHQKPEEATACIDMFEFPNIPCAYPVVWVRAKEAAEICAALGKRLCDAHEWEGACAGSLEAPDYRFDLAENRDVSSALRLMRSEHNRKYAAGKTWSYGPEYRKGVCAASSRKSPG